MRSLLLYLMVVAMAIAVASCGRKNEIKVERAFYYWKTAPHSLVEKESEVLYNIKVKKLYIKFFEVAPDPILSAIPVSKTNFKLETNYYYNDDNPVKNYQDWQRDSLTVIPTIFVLNETLKDITGDQLDSLAKNINFLIKKYYREKFNSSFIRFEEIQIDCDWTESTSTNYFELLRKVKVVSGKQVSCTLRLYPYKYPDKMGVPPVDRVMLMCYNLLSPLEENKNTILDLKELESYLAGVPRYPLPIDVALPIYSWHRLYRNDKYIGTVQPDNYTSQFFTEISPFWFEANSECVIGSYFVKSGDKIKVESTDPELINGAIAIILKSVDIPSPVTISLFHLDESILKTHDQNTIDHYYTSFSR
jgi:hypothetical protein